MAKKIRGQNGGKRKGAGRKPKAVELKLLERMDSVLGADWENALLKKALEQALEGSYPHQSLLLAYKYGKPQERIETSGELAIVWDEVKTYKKK